MYYIIIVIIIFVICIIIGSIKSYGNRMLFYPDKNKYYTLPDNINNININGIDAYYYHVNDNYPIILYSHGNSGNINSRLPWIYDLSLLQCNVIMYDYRGFGNSNGEFPTTLSIRKDGIEVYNWMKEKYPTNRYILWGESMGGSVTSYLAYEYRYDNIDLVVMASAFSSLEDVVSDMLGNFIGTIFSKCQYCPNNVYYLSKINTPVLIIHSYDDKLISYKQCYKIKQNVKSACEIITTKGGHNSSFIDKKTQISSYIQQNLRTV